MSQKISRRDFLKGSSALLGATLLHRLLPGVGSVPLSQAKTGADARPNVLILVFDALSATNMSLYGYPRRTTPHMERFAERATVFHRHYAAGNFTTPGVASMVTGTYPWTNRAFNHAGTVLETYRRKNLFTLFKEHGYHTVAYSHNLLTNSILNQCGDHIDLHLSPYTFCLNSGELGDRVFSGDADIAWRGFEDLILQRSTKVSGSLWLSLVDRVRLAVQHRLRARPHAKDYPRGVPNLFKLSFLLEDVIKGLADLAEEVSEPYLAYFHVLPPHEPYKPHRDFIGLFDDGWRPEPKEEHVFSDGVSQDELDTLRRQYDEFLAYTDFHFGRLLDRLEEHGTLDDTILVVTSDHGQLFERGIHGHVTPTLYDPVIHVPLLVVAPGQAERRDVHVPTSSVDLLPSLAQLTLQQDAAWSEGFPLFEDADLSPERGVYAVEATGNPKHSPLTKATVSLIKGDHKLIRYLGHGGAEAELYDLQENARETRDLYGQGLVVANELEHKLDRALEEVNKRYA